MNDDLARMHDRCDPYVFYWKIRPYLAGWENMADAGLPLGLIYEGVHDEPIRYAGGSAAQSSLIAALDIAFGIRHYKTGDNHGKNTFLFTMRKYMPGPHRQFLEDLDRAANIRPYMLQLLENYKNGNVSALEIDIIESYNQCLSSIKAVSR